MIGLAIEAATSHVEVALFRGERVLAHAIEEVGHGHTQRLTPLVGRVLDEAATDAAALGWVAVDLGPGSFTGVRVGIASGEGFALASGARLIGASSLAALAHGTRARRALVVPMVPGGRVDAYAGFFRADSRGLVRLMAAPRVGRLEPLLDAIREAREAAGLEDVVVVGPGAARWQSELEQAFPGATAAAHRFEGLSAIDLAHAAQLERGAAAGLPGAGDPPRPLYVRPAQAEERVRHRALAADRVVFRAFHPDDIPAVVEIEQRTFSDPWTPEFFLGELEQSQVYARVAEREGAIAGYSIAWLGEGGAHLGNIAVDSPHRRLGVGRSLLREVLAESERRGLSSLTLEVRVSNFAAQELYRVHAFRLAGLRRGYYRDTGEDALLMEWRPEYAAVGAPPV
ncbi:MAG: tRNA (adenosine(37)-N6)-threonylcarbamoyltransferase complex dimerization subunit type 1 TsaB [Candidatus Eisenbacteria bacterium]|uniref:tRNA (Adenosine(37)-N6)-threonylcarbamoyltransferase complex dimerization subunit type 1 TsaB n=1 Tax=Eiseniibacteriota bacterium TaxID=2212470 RepID=A0A849SWD6_UNCEI|nr:tRNA (adenosine(37)-N6)-threonylcarbamoyltransferase complex dimerization subunit type 1 TsaB [Candidatus Eisenbacteria bacterium]